MFHCQAGDPSPWFPLSKSKALSLGKVVQVLLYDPYSDPPVMDSKIISQAVTGVIGPWVTGKLAGAQICCLWESDIIDLYMVLHLTDRQPVPVYVWIRPMNLTSVCCHQPLSIPVGCAQYAQERALMLEDISRTHHGCKGHKPL